MKPILCLLLLFSFGCGDGHRTIDGPSDSCAANTVLIGVHDANLTALCGCNEGSGRTALAGETLTCTVSFNPATVIFQFIEIQLSHQILFDNTTLISSRLRSPDDEFETHALEINQSGTHIFRDRALTGQIIVP